METLYSILAFSACCLLYWLLIKFLKGAAKQEQAYEKAMKTRLKSEWDWKLIELGVKEDFDEAFLKHPNNKYCVISDFDHIKRFDDFIHFTLAGWDATPQGFDFWFEVAEGRNPRENKQLKNQEYES